MYKFILFLPLVLTLYLTSSQANAGPSVDVTTLDIAGAPCVRLVVHPKYLYKLLDRGRSRVDHEVLVRTQRVSPEKTVTTRVTFSGRGIGRRRNLYSNVV